MFACEENIMIRRLCAIVAFTVIAAAVEAQSQFRCPSPSDVRARLATAREQIAARRSHALDVVSPAPVEQDGLYVVNGDSRVLSDSNPFDLEGQTLLFTPVDALHYSLKRLPLSYVEPAGAPFHDFDWFKDPSPYVAYTVRTLDIPIFGHVSNTLYISWFNSIHVAPPQLLSRPNEVTEPYAYLTLDPVIAPLYFTTNGPLFAVSPLLFVEEKPDSLIVTWRTGPSRIDDQFIEDIQTRLFTDGRIEFSYRQTHGIQFGTVLLNPGLAASVIPEKSVLHASDAAGDVDAAIPAAVAPMLDIRSVDVTRFGQSDFVRARVQFGAPLDTAKLAPGQFAHYQIGGSMLTLRPDGTSSFGSTSGPVLGSVSADAVTVYLPAPTTGTMNFAVSTQLAYNNGSAPTVTADSFTASESEPASRPWSSDLSAVGETDSLELPVMEPFTLPALDPTAAWDEVKATFGIDESSVTAVGVYQTFYTDLIFYAAGYSTQGALPIKGIGRDANATGTYTAPVMDLDDPMEQPDRFTRQVVLHEFGHCWLYTTHIKEDGTLTDVLSPDGTHPAQWVDTRAAFPVFTDHDSSVMGGGFFTTAADGSFLTGTNSGYGYSWTDLYLMGLAAPEEVPDWFYIRDSNPPLGVAYFPPDNIDVHGTRRNVSIGQLIDGNGPRIPSAANSPKSFRMVVIVVTENGAALTDAQRARLHFIRSDFEALFQKATGGRGTVSTGLTEQPRRRAVNH